MSHDVTKSGVLDSTLTLPIPNWITRPILIPLPLTDAPFHGTMFRIGGVKHPDGTLEMTVEGPFRRMYTLKGAIPHKHDDRTLPARIIWGDGVVKLEICGEIVAMQIEVQGV